jgi:dihydropteroate synthase
VLEAYRQGATIFRVHDVGPTVQALKVARAIAGSRQESSGNHGGHGVHGEEES